MGSTLLLCHRSLCSFLFLWCLFLSDSVDATTGSHHPAISSLERSNGSVVQHYQTRNRRWSRLQQYWNKSPSLSSSPPPHKASTMSSSTTNTDKMMLQLLLVGGACSDSDPELFRKIGSVAIIQTIAMAGFVLGSMALSKQIGRIISITSTEFFRLPWLVWPSLFAIIFGSSFFGLIAKGGLSAATFQVLEPNMVPGDPNWYNHLKKPSWNPPGWLFPIMWLIIVKPTQLVAVSRILQRTILSDNYTGSYPPVIPLLVYCFHLSLGDAWNKVFFDLQCTGRGAAVISIFCGVLLTSSLLFYTLDPIAGIFMIPACSWVMVATALNWSIYRLNK